MLVICYGRPKSGKTMIYQMVWDLLEAYGYPQQAYRQNKLRSIEGASAGGMVNMDWKCIGQVFADTIRDNNLVVRTQGSLTQAVKEHLRSFTIKAFVISRSEEGSAASLYRHALRVQSNSSESTANPLGRFSTKEQALQHIIDQAPREEEWRECPQSVVFNFQDLCVDAPRVVMEIARHLNLEKVAEPIADRYAKFMRRIEKTDSVFRSCLV